MMRFAPYQSCFNAASARWTDTAEMSHMTWSQYGSFTARKMRSFACGPGGRSGTSLFGSRAAGAGVAGVLAGAAGLAGALAAGFGVDFAEPLVPGAAAVRERRCVPLAVGAAARTDVRVRATEAVLAGRVTLAADLAAGFGSALAT